MKKPLLIPFATEPPHRFIGGYVRPGDARCLWRGNHVFDDGLAIVGVTRSGHRANFLLKSVNDGAEYPLFFSELLPALTHGQVTHRVVDGELRPVVVGHWTFAKKGTEYGLRAVRPGEA